MLVKYTDIINIKDLMKKKDARILCKNTKKFQNYVIKEKIHLIKKYANLYINLIKNKDRKKQEIIILKYIFIRNEIKNNIRTLNNVSFNF